MPGALIPRKKSSHVIPDTMHPSRSLWKVPFANRITENSLTLPAACSPRGSRADPSKSTSDNVCLALITLQCFPSSQANSQGPSHGP